MGIQKIEIGDIFEVPTAIGNAYIQYMAEVDQTTLIRLLPGVYHEPVDLEKLVQQKERYICFVRECKLNCVKFSFVVSE